MGQETIKLTTAQAIVKWLSNQFINIDGKEFYIVLDRNLIKRIELDK